jgi:hypothetical protein
MLKDSKGNKPSLIDISESQFKEMIQYIKDGIFRKLNAVRNMQKIDRDIAGGLYVYAVEEFGKLLLLRDAPSLNGMRKVKYEKGFVKHEMKIKLAFDYFRNNGFEECLVLAQDCIKDAEPASDDVVVALAADTEARLSIFYSDFVYDKNLKPVIESPPYVEPKMLQRANDQLENATIGLRI